MSVFGRKDDVPVEPKWPPDCADCGCEQYDHRGQEGQCVRCACLGWRPPLAAVNEKS